VKVTLTVEAGDGQLSHVDAEGETYEKAKAAAEVTPADSARKQQGN
jgi:hypothetical protein